MDIKLNLSIETNSFDFSMKRFNFIFHQNLESWIYPKNKFLSPALNVLCATLNGILYSESPLRRLERIVVGSV